MALQARRVQIKLAGVAGAKGFAHRQKIVLSRAGAGKGREQQQWEQKRVGNFHAGILTKLPVESWELRVGSNP